MALADQGEHDCGFYRLADTMTWEEGKALGFKADANLPSHFSLFQTRHVRAKATGEKRCPKAGEWFLSGAEVHAYRAKNDLSTAYHIARLVRVKEITVLVEV